MQKNWMNYSKNSHIPITQRPHSSWTNCPNNVLSIQKKKKKKKNALRNTLRTWKLKREDDLHLKQYPALP